MNRTILIDGDILTYQIGFSVQTPIYVCGGKLYKTRGKAKAWADKHGLEVFKRINTGSIQQARLNLKAKMLTIFNDLRTKDYKIYITGGKLEDNFRTKIALIMPYKANREFSEKPFHYAAIRDILVKEYKAEAVYGQEADDAIGIEQYRRAKQYNSFEGTVIASIDKDLRMLQGYHYNLNSRQTDYIAEDQALKNFYGQMLKGDPTDNIPGLTKLLKKQGRLEESKKLSYAKPGYLKTYEKMAATKTTEECRQYVLGLYHSHGISKEELEEIGQLLWIRREENELWLL